MNSEHRILFLSPGAELLPWPADWLVRYYDARRNVPCDMLVGPCACGGWHCAEQWSGRDTAHVRKLFGTPVLEFYNTEIQKLPENPTREQLVSATSEEYVTELEVQAASKVDHQKEQRTLSYF